MTKNPIERDNARTSGRSSSRARAKFKAGSVEGEVEVDLTSAGLVAIGAMVSLILVSVPTIIRAAKRNVPPVN